MIALVWWSPYPPQLTQVCSHTMHHASFATSPKCHARVHANMRQVLTSKNACCVVIFVAKKFHHSTHLVVEVTFTSKVKMIKTATGSTVASRILIRHTHTRTGGTDPLRAGQHVFGLVHGCMGSMAVADSRMVCNDCTLHLSCMHVLNLSVLTISELFRVNSVVNHSLAAAMWTDTGPKHYAAGGAHSPQLLPRGGSLAPDGLCDGRGCFEWSHGFAAW